MRPGAASGRGGRGATGDRGVADGQPEAGRWKTDGLRATLRPLTRALVLLAASVSLPVSVFRLAAQTAQLTSGRFTVVSDPADAMLARALLASATERDSFPGLPRPRLRVTIAIAVDAQRFRQLAGAGAPEWGAAVAIPAESRIVMQGRAANSRAGDPIVVLRHELAHLALHEALGDRPPRWFDEGYASFSANEWGRDEMLAANLALAMRRGRTLAGVDSGFDGGQMGAEASYALAHRAVAELAALDRERGLSLLFEYWKESPRLDAAMRRAYGITLDGFERRWQERTRMRYGALAVFTDLTLASLLLLALIVPLYVMRRRRDRRRLAAMRTAEALADQRATDSVIEELLRTVPPMPPPTGS